jgi:acetoin utilization protein AcuB
MKVREVMTAWPITVGPDHTLGEAIEQMLRRQVRSLPVVEDRRVVGMLTDRDVRVALGHDALDLDLATLEGAALEEPVRAWMTHGAATLGPEEPVGVACRALAAGRIGAMPIVDDEGEVVGILSTTDLLTAAADLFDDLE